MPSILIFGLVNTCLTFVVAHLKTEMDGCGETEKEGIGIGIAKRGVGKIVYERERERQHEE